MKIIFTIILTLSFGLASYTQETFTTRKGSKFFPGHLHMVINVDSTGIHYQLFNHWYSLSYAQYRDVKIPISELENYGEQNDTLRIIVADNKIKLVDKRNKLNRKVKHQSLCASVETMRKISYANSIAEKHENMRHFHLYEREDLTMAEEDFRTLVDQNLKKEMKK
ncbi:MAG: hypothetical protein P8N52_10070 [Crocinitomicaceae bacterium]|nr:hypothetical protein [Crocinitomicaceae bacterium]MDG1776319.1 hypothetical protein [Crocinitomicaceae bacterium]